MKEIIRNHEDVMNMLDSLLREPAPFWDHFYSEREKGVPFFVNKPDENLVEYFDHHLFSKGNVLELGCGPGRNACYFAEKGCLVDAIDLSSESLKWAEERNREKNLSINFIHKNIFEFEVEPESYDIIYDSGCFHHIAPHRRLDYIELINKGLKPGAYFALTCFVEGGELGGSDLSDWEVYRARSLKGGLGFTKEKLQAIFQLFTPVEIRKMKEVGQHESVFGVSALWTAVFQKREE